VLFQRLQRADKDTEGAFIIARARASRLEPGNALVLLRHDQSRFSDVPHGQGQFGLMLLA
jgi:hypothetical protein